MCRQQSWVAIARSCLSESGNLCCFLLLAEATGSFQKQRSHLFCSETVFSTQSNTGVRSVQISSANSRFQLIQTDSPVEDPFLLEMHCEPLPQGPSPHDPKGPNAVSGGPPQGPAMAKSIPAEKHLGLLEPQQLLDAFHGIPFLGVQRAIPLPSTKERCPAVGAEPVTSLTFAGPVKEGARGWRQPSCWHGLAL